MNDTEEEHREFPIVDRLERLIRIAAMIIVSVVGVIVGTIIIGGSLVIGEAVDDDAEDYIDTEQAQILVHVPRNAEGFPIVTWGEGFTVEARICNTSDAPITVVGNMKLEFEIPSGVETVTIFTDGSELLLPGCTFWLERLDECPVEAAECKPAFVNVPHRNMTADALVRGLLADGINPVVQLTGDLDPEQGGISNARWFTEQFVITEG